jgi:hypothetical protein
LALLGCVSLCSCELSPGAHESAFDDDQNIAPHAQLRSGLADPRNYMDKDAPNLQRLISSHYMQQY